MASIYDIEVQDINGKTETLESLRGKYLLVVNVASQCGFTPQYKGLEELYRELGDKVEVLGFPCDQFGGQEPGGEEEIKNFCSLSYDVTFPMFAKIEVNGDKAHPLYQFLKAEKPGLLGTQAIKWNFTKFLVSPEGEVLARYAPTDKPEKIRADIKRLLS